MLNTLQNLSLFNEDHTNSIIYSLVTSIEDIEELDCALTFEGLQLSYDNLELMFNWIQDYSSLNKKKFYLIKGHIMNSLFNLTDKYPDNLNIICIDTKDIKNLNALVVPRFSVGGRWLNDIIANYY